MKQYNLSKAIDKGRLLSKIYAELLKLREIITKIQRELENKQQLKVDCCNTVAQRAAWGWGQR